MNKAKPVPSPDKIALNIGNAIRNILIIAVAIPAIGGIAWLAQFHLEELALVIAVVIFSYLLIRSVMAFLKGKFIVESITKLAKSLMLAVVFGFGIFLVAYPMQEYVDLDYEYSYVFTGALFVLSTVWIVFRK